MDDGKSIEVGAARATLVQVLRQRPVETPFLSFVPEAGVMHPEAQGWIDEVVASAVKAMRSKKAGAYEVALNRFAMACPHGPPSICMDCSTEYADLRPGKEFYVLRWVHDYHLVYDTVYHAALKNAGVLAFLRRAVQRDLAVDISKCRRPDSCEGNCTCADGNIIHRPTGRILLDNFLVEALPPEWGGT